MVVYPPQHISGDLGALPCTTEKDTASQGRRGIGDVVPHRPFSGRLGLTVESGLAIFHGGKRQRPPVGSSWHDMVVNAADER
jgi:hypothetical protein